MSSAIEKFWLGVALISAVMLMGYVIQQKGLESSEAGTWAQAIGTVGAMGTAIWVYFQQVRHSRHAAAHKDVLVLRALWESAKTLIEEMEFAAKPGPIAPAYLVFYREHLEADLRSVSAIDPTSPSSGDAAVALINLRRTLLTCQRALSGLGDANQVRGALKLLATLKSSCTDTLSTLGEVDDALQRVI